MREGHSSQSGGDTGEKFRLSLESTKQFDRQIGTFPFVEVCRGNKDEKSEWRQIEQVLIATLKNLDLVLYSEKDFCWTVSDIRCALQEDNGNSMNPSWGQRKTRWKRLDRKLFNSLDSP